MKYYRGLHLKREKRSFVKII